MMEQTSITAEGVIDTFLGGAESIAGGVILLVLAREMVLGKSDPGDHLTAEKEPMQLAQFPLAVPYLLNPVGIVGLVTISAETKSLDVFVVMIAILVFVLLDVAVFRWANVSVPSSTKTACW